jgi:hypothetical protein
MFSFAYPFEDLVQRREIAAAIAQHRVIFGINIE